MSFLLFPFVVFALVILFREPLGESYWAPVSSVPLRTSEVLDSACSFDFIDVELLFSAVGHHLFIRIDPSAPGQQATFNHRAVFVLRLGVLILLAL